MNILMVDAQKMIRETLSTHLGNILCANVTQARNGLEGLTFFKDRHFDLVIVDTRMPVMSGREMIREMMAIDTKTKVIALSMVDDLSSIMGMFESGAQAYVLKEGDPSFLLEAIGNVLEGGYYFSASLKQTVDCETVEKALRDRSRRLATNSIDAYPAKTLAYKMAV